MYYLSIDVSSEVRIYDFTLCAALHWLWDQFEAGSGYGYLIMKQIQLLVKTSLLIIVHGLHSLAFILKYPQKMTRRYSFSDILYP